MPVAPIGLRRLLLCLFIPLAVAALFIVGFKTLKEAPVSDLKSYSGVLSRTRNATPIYLPAGVQVKSLFANAGDPVLRGQTIGIIDTMALGRKIIETNDELRLKRSLRECLTGILTKVDQPATASPPILPSDLEPRLNPAPPECLDIHAETLNRDFAFSDKQAILKQRLDIIQSKQRILIKAARKNGVETDLSDALAIHSLENAMKITSLQQALTDLARANREAATLFHQRQRAKIATLTKEILSQEQDLATLEQMQLKPLLRAPTSGTANPFDSDGRSDRHASSDFPILEIIEQGPPIIEVSFLITEKDAAETPIGSLVHIKPLGTSGSQLSFTGEISGYYANNSLPDTDPKITAEVTLSADSMQRLLANMQRQSHQAQQAAIILNVTKAPKSLGNILSQHELVMPLFEKISQLEHQVLERFSRYLVEDQTLPDLTAVQPIEEAG